MNKLLGVGLILLISSHAWAQGSTKKPSAPTTTAPKAPAATSGGSAGGGGSSAPRSSGSSSLEGQAKTIKYKSETTVDFEDTIIEGAAKNPFMSMISNRDGEMNRGFIKIRTNWHDMLVMSITGLGQ